MKPVLVGLSNPYSRDPRMALYPWPAKGSGARLVKLLGWSVEEYMRSFERVNAEDYEPRQVYEMAGEAEVWLLGREVAARFGFRDDPLWSVRGNVRILPHPSGLCRAWNDDGAVEKLREMAEPHRVRTTEAT